MNNIISNLNSDNHYKKIQELFTEATDVIIASPFLMTDFHTFFSEMNISNLCSLRLITTFKPNDIDQIKKVDSFISVIDFFDSNYSKVKYLININNKLHGKVYIFKKEGLYLSAIITSANFTDNGLTHNHEWGIEIEDTSEIEKLENELISTIQLTNITVDDILKMLYEVDEFRKKHPIITANKIELDLYKMLPMNNTIHNYEDRQFWLKPLGVSDSPINEGESFGDKNKRLDFSKRRPSGVNIEDIIIPYGVGIKKILGMYKVVSHPYHASSDVIENEPWRERWPWAIDCENLSKEYGEKWWEYDLVTTNLVNEYLQNNPYGSITHVGGKTLGGLNFGADKLRLDSKFANYIIMRIKNEVSN